MTPELTKALEITLIGMLGIFFVLGMIYLLIKLLIWAFPERKVVRRLVDKATGKVLKEEEVKNL